MEVLLILIVFAAVGYGIYKWQAAESAKLTQANLRSEANSFIDNLAETQSLPEISVNIVLKRGEKGILQEDSRLMETRAVRYSKGIGTRIGRIYVGGARSESNQEYKEIDRGTLILTTQRLVFDGGSQSRATNVGDIMSVSPWQDAIEVSSTKRQKSQVYMVKNPLIWATMIKGLAEGTIRASESSNG